MLSDWRYSKRLMTRSMAVLWECSLLYEYRAGSLWDRRLSSCVRRDSGLMRFILLVNIYVNIHSLFGRCTEACLYNKKQIVFHHLLDATDTRLIDTNLWKPYLWPFKSAPVPWLSFTEIMFTSCHNIQWITIQRIYPQSAKL